MVVDVPIRTDKHTVHAHTIIVVDVANFDTIDTTMSISTILHITMERSNHLTFLLKITDTSFFSLFEH